jgi:hypothetical protein
MKTLLNIGEITLVTVGMLLFLWGLFGIYLGLPNISTGLVFFYMIFMSIFVERLRAFRKKQGFSN